MTMLAQAAIIMVTGMALTFLFLAIVIIGVETAARILHRYEGVPAEDVTPNAPLAQRDRLRRLAVAAVALHVRGLSPTIKE